MHRPLFVFKALVVSLAWLLTTAVLANENPGLAVAGTGSKAAPGCLWRSEPSPNRNPRKMQNGLVATLAIAPDDAWASEEAVIPKEGGVFRSLMLHWNGARWRSMSLAIKSRHGLVAEMTALSSSDVWAVTSHAVEHWDGTHWAIVPASDPGTHSWQLMSVSAAAPDDLWAVGHTNDHGSSATLAEHWDGIRWSIVPSPNPPPRPLTSKPSAYFTDVAVVSSDDVWAVGASSNQTPGAANTLIEHWDGTSWSVASSPDIPSPSGTPFDVLWSISAASANEAWAAGAAGGFSNGREKSIILRWDGATWSSTKVPPVRGSAFLFSVTGSVDNGLWAAPRPRCPRVAAFLVSRSSYGRQLGSLLDRPGAARRVMAPVASAIT